MNGYYHHDRDDDFAYCDDDLDALGLSVQAFLSGVALVILFGLLTAAALLVVR